MPLADGDRPADGDVWFRVLTSQSHIAKGGRVNHAAFKGNFMRPPKASKNRAWDAEASGRIRSIAGSNEQITADAEAYCTRYSTKFFGLMFPKRRLPGTTLENLQLDFSYTPIPNEDEAHTDLTFTGSIPAEKTEAHEKLVIALVETFHAIGTGQIELLPAVTAPMALQPAPQPDSLLTTLRSAWARITSRF